MQYKRQSAFFLAFVLIISILCGCQAAQEPTLDFKVEEFRVPVYEDYVPVEPEDNHIMMGAPVGSWTRDIANDGSYGIRCSFDMRESTKWNPQANPGYVGDPGVVYLLDGYYDVDTWTMQFKGNSYYFDLLVSENGKDYTLLRSVTADNVNDYFNEDFLCTFENLGAKRVAYVRIMFKGAGRNNSFVNLHEMSFTGTYIAPGPISIPKEDNPYALPESLIASHSISGAWSSDLATDTGYGPNKAYDSNPFSKWNPMAKTGYAEEPGVVYALKGAVDVGKLQLMFSSGIYYFDVYVSGDGIEYTPVAKINKLNAEKGYTEGEDGAQVCTLDGLKLEDVSYIKITFTGRTDGNRYVNLTEVIVSEEITEGLDTSWMLPDPSQGELTILSHTVLGEWIRDIADDPAYGVLKSYDGDTGTKWNPQVKTNYAGEPGVIYQLNRAANLNKIAITVSGTSHYFDIYTSVDGTIFTLLKQVNADNENEVYSGLICTLDNLGLEGVTHIKLVLTGRSNNSTYINLQEVEIGE